MERWRLFFVGPSFFPFFPPPCHSILIALLSFTGGKGDGGVKGCPTFVGVIPTVYNRVTFLFYFYSFPSAEPWVCFDSVCWCVGRFGDARCQFGEAFFGQLVPPNTAIFLYYYSNSSFRLPLLLLPYIFISPPPSSPTLTAPTETAPLHLRQSGLVSHG